MRHWSGWKYGAFEVTVKCLTCGNTTVWKTAENAVYSGQCLTVAHLGGCDTCAYDEVQAQCTQCKVESA